MKQPEIVYLDEKGRRICGAPTANGTPCRRRVLQPNGRCDKPNHGGNAPSPGPTHHSWQHGRSSKLLESIPYKMRDGFVAAMTDPDIISVRTEIGLVDSRILSLIGNLAQEQYSDKWKKHLEQSLDKLKIHLSTGEDLDHDAVLQTIADTEVALLHNDGDHRVWRDVLEAVEARRRLVDTERRLLEAHQASIDVSQMRAILLHVLTAVREHVLPLDGGRGAVEGIAREVRKLLIPRPDRARAIQAAHRELDLDEAVGQ